jgi:hypothetical protein
MFNFFKKKDKDKDKETTTQVIDQEVPWGVPVKRKLSRKEEEAEAAEQALVEGKNRERRDMYRLPGTERIFNDAVGRRLALRFEDNTGPKASPHHPPLFLAAFWGTRELAHLTAEITDGMLKVTDYRTEGGYEGWGIPGELLAEVEKIARNKGATAISCALDSANPKKDWDSSLFNRLGFQARGAETVKAL